MAATEPARHRGRGSTKPRILNLLVQGTDSEVAEDPASSTVRAQNPALEAALFDVQRKVASFGELRHEFKRIQWRAGSNRKSSIAEREDSTDLNRYWDSLPFDYNRVILHREEQQDTGYINASHLSSSAEDVPDWHYVLTQGPLQATIGDFWMMVWALKSPIIIMLTAAKEENVQGIWRSMSAVYWPEQPGMCIYNHIIVTLKSQELIQDDVVKRILSIRNIYDSTDTDYTVTHYQYTGWKDSKPPEDVSTIRSLLSILHQSGCIPLEAKRPAIIHCNSGIGRSAAFVAMSAAKHKLHALKPGDRSKAKAAVDMYTSLTALRKQRNSAVHTIQLLSFVYKVLEQELLSMLGFE